MKKIVCIIMAMTACLLVLSGCGNVSKYHAEIFDDIGGYIINHYVMDTPFTVNNEEEFHKIFNDTFDPNIDFESQMLIVYKYKDTNLHKKKISKIEFDNENIKIYIKDKYFHSPLQKDTTSPYQRWIAIKMDKVQFDSLEFEDED